jgi:hypothetical protein
MWTIHDFPGYKIVFSCQHQGYKACLPCGSNIVSRWSKKLGKPIFEGSRRWLQRNHPYKTHLNAKHFNGKEELRRRPQTTIATETLRWAQRTEDWVAEGNVLGAKGCPSRETGIKRRSTVFQLPYWDVSVTIIYYPNLLCILTSRLAIMWGYKPSWRTPNSLRDSNVNPSRKQWKREESRHVPWLTALWGVEGRAGAPRWD